MTLFEFERGMLESNLGNIKYWALFAAIVLVSAGADKISDVLLENFQLLRRLLLWNHDIEGVWADFTINKSTGEFIDVGWVTIHYSKGHFRLDGTAWYPTENRQMVWKTEQSEFSEHKLLYRYSSAPFGHALKAVQGAGFVEFTSTKPGARFDQFVGDFIDLYDARECMNVGERVRIRAGSELPVSDVEKLAILRESMERRLPAVLHSLGHPHRQVPRPQ